MSTTAPQRTSQSEPHSFETGPYDDLLAELWAAARDCASLADRCLLRGEPRFHQCARLALDCADIATTTSKLMVRQMGANHAVVAGMLMLCEALCRDCACECDLIADAEPKGRLCAVSCRRCEALCLAARVQLARRVVQ